VADASVIQISKDQEERYIKTSFLLWR